MISFYFEHVSYLSLNFVTGVLSYVPILAVAVIALPVLIVVSLLVWNLKIKRM